jgi:transcriptional regulator with XRE-family HTH domain
MPKRSITLAFALVLKKHRLAARFSQEHLAEKADVHPTYIGLLERGLRTPGIEVCERLAQSLGKKLSDLIIEAEQAAKK